MNLVAPSAGFLRDFAPNAAAVGALLIFARSHGLSLPRGAEEYLVALTNGVGSARSSAGAAGGPRLEVRAR